MLAARAQAIKHLKQHHPFVEEGHLLSKLIGYCSKEAHSCVEKAAMISFVKLRILEPDEKCSLRGDTLTKAMEEDELQGLVPFFVSTTLGTTGSCSFDALEEIGIALQRFPNVWLHVDAAYAGNSFICPELKPLLKVCRCDHANRWAMFGLLHICKNFPLTFFYCRASNTPIHSIQIPINGFLWISIVHCCGYVIAFGLHLHLWWVLANFQNILILH